jgi:hypothetical protein
MIKLTGTGTGFDTLYYPDEIGRTITPAGFKMEVTAKNIPPSAQTVIPNSGNAVTADNVDGGF